MVAVGACRRHLILPMEAPILRTRRTLHRILCSAAPSEAAPVLPPHFPAFLNKRSILMMLVMAMHTDTVAAVKSRSAGKRKRTPLAQSRTLQPPPSPAECRTPKSLATQP